jgi:hypothetical protein
MVGSTVSFYFCLVVEGMSGGRSGIGKQRLFVDAHPEMANLPDIGVAQKI